MQGGPRTLTDIRGLWFGSHMKRLEQFLRRRRLQRSDADDVTQEVYLRLIQVENPAGIEDPWKYMHTVTLNVMRDGHKATWSRIGQHSQPIDDTWDRHELVVE